jgi:predicted transcriptional regulator
MGPRRKAAPDRLLTGTELELMTIVWELGGGTVADVLARLPPERPLAYTSVATILRILEQKGVLRSEKQGRGHRYEPLVARDDYQAFALQQVVGNVFGGEPVELVRRLIDGGLSDEEIASLRRLLKESR